MKTLVAFLSVLVLGTTTSMAGTTDTGLVTASMANYGNPFIFVEDGITFSVYPDGEFDFYIDDRVQVGANVNFGNTAITFNSGFNYDPFVQYDDYGAVIQIENIPIYYDYYGRVSQIGAININYRNGRLYRLGGMHIYYNPRGVFTHYTGYVNVYNRYYVYRPFHQYFIRPAVGFCLVNVQPYRRYYEPVRYTYYRPYRHNYRKSYARIGHAYDYRKAPRRENIYRNDKRVAVRDNSYRRSHDYRSNQNASTRRDAISSDRRTVKRNDASNYRNEAKARSNGRSSVTSSRDNAGRRSTVSDNKTVRRSTTSNRSYERGNAPANRNIERRSAPSNRSIERGTAPSQRSSYSRAEKPERVSRDRSVVQRKVTRSPESRTVTRKNDVRKSVSPARSYGSKSTVQRSTVKRTISKAPSRAVRSSQGNLQRSSAKRVN